MPDELLLNEPAYAVWQTIYNAGHTGMEISEIVEQTGSHQSQVAATVAEAAAQSFFNIEEREHE
ncbi:MAG TPA: hypothetical protein VHE81_14120, partial [Lacipirellulaceae bacterium]|nr:hypothetical protein [Lacipirellulaceae bacterium]